MTVTDTPARAGLAGLFRRRGGGNRRSSKDEKAPAADVVEVQQDGQPLGMPAARPFVLDGPEQLFLVRGEPLVEMDHRTLQRVGIDPDQRADFGGHGVWAFTRSELEFMLEKLDLYVEQRKGSTHPNAEWVILGRMRDVPQDVRDETYPRMLDYRFEVTRDARRNSHGPARGMWYLISRALGPVLKQKIVVDVPHGYHRAYAERGAFQVLIWSSSSRTTRDVYPPSYIWGHYVDYQGHVFQPSNGGVSVPGVLLMDDEYAVAELLPRALYVHHDLVHHGSRNERAIMRRLIEEVAPYFSETGDVLSGALAQAKERWQAQQREAFAQLVTDSIPARQSRVKQAIDDAKERVDEARAEYAAAERELFLLRASTVSTDEIAKRFKEEFAKVQRGDIALVDGVSIDLNSSEPTVWVRTKEIIAVDRNNGNQHMLGRFDIALRLGNGDVRFHNLEREVGEYAAPHVASTGQACLGNISGDLASYIANYEIEAAITLAIAFLQNPNMDDAEGRVVRHFPLVKRGEGRQ